MADKYVPKKAAGGQTKLREWWNAVVESNFGVLYRAINDHFNGTDDRHTAEQVDYGDGKTVKAAIDEKADRETSDGGFAGGMLTEAGMGGAAGNCAGTGSGGASGYNAYSSDGGAMGENASAGSGGAVGYNASSANGSGFAGGSNAVAGNGGAIGVSAETIDGDGNVIDAVQLGTGTNPNAKTLQVYNYQMMDANGKIPAGRLPEGVGGLEVIDTGFKSFPALLASAWFDTYTGTVGKVEERYITYDADFDTVKKVILKFSVSKFAGKDFTTTKQVLDCSLSPYSDASDPLSEGSYMKYMRIGSDDGYSWGQWQPVTPQQRPGRQGYTDTDTRRMLKSAESYTVARSGSTVSFTSPQFSVVMEGRIYTIPQLQKTLDGITVDKFYKLYVIWNHNYDDFSILPIECGANPQEFTPALLSEYEHLIGAFGTLRYNEAAPANPYIFEPAETIDVSGDLMAFDIYCRQSFPVDSAYYTAESCQKLDDPSGVMQAIHNAGYDNLMDFINRLGRAAGLLEG